MTPKTGRAASRPPDTPSTARSSLRALTTRVMLVHDADPAYGEMLRTSSDVVRALAEEAATWDREHFLVIGLDGKNRLLGVTTVSIGTLSASLVHPREVMKSLILANAAAFVLVHNHPSGDPTPSAEDLAITSRLKECAELFGMRLLDHVILGHGRYCSMCDESLL